MVTKRKIENQSFAEQWYRPFVDLWTYGKTCNPRGIKTLEIEDYQFSLNTRNKFAAFEARNLSVKYLIGELAWYLCGDGDDTRIEEYSSFWKTVRNEKVSHGPNIPKHLETPYYYSNYGAYIFGEGQFNYVVDILKNDWSSRQACIVINRPHVMMSDSKDKLCTYAISFRIRDNKLNMSVSMRSNDLIFGTCVDVFQFLIIYDLLLAILRDTYPYLERGLYTHKADSFHVYEKHFEMLDKVVSDKFFSNDLATSIPEIKNSYEARYIIENLPTIERNKVSINDEENVPEFVKWCLSHIK